MKKIVSVKLLYFVIISCFAQDTIDFRNYSPLICKGVIPQDFKIELSKLVEKEKQNQSGANSTEKTQAVKFSELSNYQLNNILFSGKVLYGDVLTEYVNKVADIILKDDKDLREELHFYVLKDANLNAYSTQRGVIFINIGLLAQIESEAQLAFIMCHEIVHYKNNHNLETYKKRQEVYSNNANIGRRLNSILNYSKENELEADREGLDFFLKTPYGTKELNSLFDVMLYSYLPFDEISFDTLYFNAAKDYVLPKEYFLKEVGGITAEEDVIDSMSTHPNIKKRRETIQSLLKTKSKSTGVSFVNSEAEFKKIQQIARYEIAIIYMQDSDLEQALYTGYLIEKVYGKTMFSDKIITGALYAKSKQKSHSDYSNAIISYTDDDDDDENWSKVEGESQAVYHFLHKIPAKELSILTLRKLCESYKLYHNDFFKERLSSVVYDLVNEFELARIDFLESYREVIDTTTQVTPDDTADATTSKVTKVSKIKKTKATQSEKKSKRRDNKYFQYALVEYCKDDYLNDYFKKREKDKQDHEAKTSSINYKKYISAKNKIIKKYGNGLNIDKMILINPFYSSYITKVYDYTRYRVSNPSVTPLDELKVEQKLLEYVLEYSGKLDLKVDIIGSTQQSSIETDRFNDFQQLINWLSERASLGKNGAFAYTDQYMERYVQEYGHLGFCHVVQHNKSLEMIFVLLNLQTGEADFVYEKKLRKGKPDGVLVQMMLYDVLHQIKQDAKKIEELKQRYQIND